MPFVGLFICSFSTRGKEEETGRGAGGGCRRFCRAGNRWGEEGKQLLTEEEREGGTMWKNCPVTTVQQACIGECHECTLVSPVTLPHFKQINPILYRLLQKPSNFFSAVFTAVTCFCHTFPNYIYVTCLIASNPLWLMWKLVCFVVFFVFFQAVILPTRQQTTYCTLTETYRRTQIYRTDTKR